MIDIPKFNETIGEFDIREGRTSFFSLASNLMSEGYKIEAYLLILTTWNFANFRYAVKDFNVESFTRIVHDLNVYFDSLKNETFESIDLDKYRYEITKIYQTLSAIKGIAFTGAPKLMHLNNPKIFVMWDGYIRGEKPMKYYKQLDVFKSGGWIFKRYGTDSDSYIQFLKDMQSQFAHIKLYNTEKSLAKAIDEFNYVTITLPIQDLEKKNQKQKRLLIPTGSRDNINLHGCSVKRIIISLQ